MPQSPEIQDEQWKPIPEFPGYEISNMGRLRSFRTWDNAPTPSEGRILAGGVDKDGYRRAVLCNGIKHRKSCRIAQLVANAWIGPRPPGLVLCHDNGNKTDNRACNLIYKTQRENIADKERHGTKRFGESHCKARLTEAQVLEIRASDLSLSALSKQYGVHKSTVEGIINRRNWRHLP